MTNKEALEIITELSKDWCRTTNTGFHHIFSALIVSREALQKQIPKIPNNISVWYEWKDEKDEYVAYDGCCPECNSLVNSNIDYCGYCGQALKWEVKDND